MKNRNITSNKRFEKRRMTALEKKNPMKNMDTEKGRENHGKFEKALVTTNKLSFKMNVEERERNKNISKKKEKKKTQCKERIEKEIDWYNFAYFAKKHKQVKTEKNCNKNGRGLAFENLKQNYIKAGKGNSYLPLLNEGHSFLTSSTALPKRQYFEKKIFRGGGYCSGIAICDSYGNLIEKVNYIRKVWENVREKEKEFLCQISESKRSIPLKNKKGSTNLKEKSQKNKDLVLPEIISTKGENHENEDFKDSENVLKLFGGRLQRTQKMKAEKNVRMKKKKRTHDERISIDGKLSIPNELLYIKTIRKEENKEKR